MNEEYRYKQIAAETAGRIREAGVRLPEDVQTALAGALNDPGLSSPGRQVIEQILKNLEIASRTKLPMCQDTGMVVAFIDIGKDSPLQLGKLEEALDAGTARAYEEGSFRRSVVEEPLYGRRNTGTNLPVIYHVSVIPGSRTQISWLLKGFGSENCSALSMLNPTAGESGVVEAVTSAVQAAGGKPCPPVVLGIGIGGTAERALLLSKRALLRKLGSRHPEEAYARLEERILAQVNTLQIGPGGFGGAQTALGVMVEHEPTHIAGLPVGVSISCWADRKAHLVLDEDGGAV